MYIRRNETGEFRGLWEQARKASEEVATWPAWKRGRLECEPSAAGQTNADTASAGDKPENQSGGDGSLSA
ncbi:MAG: hypothetical protein JW940_15420 [Polyangiaceae bacterium]|jgi:hypothetical protein|nr:hypothetical protein [Polyangiaceae bacterium]